jgi:hypothetical protein
LLFFQFGKFGLLKEQVPSGKFVEAPVDGSGFIDVAGEFGGYEGEASSRVYGRCGVGFSRRV